VLSLGASLGLLVVGDANKVWIEQAGNCNRIDFGDLYWWRVPLYLLCSVFVLGQYRFPIVKYWRALVTMYVGYEVQYRSFEYLATIHSRDMLDIAISNVLGCAAAVVSACILSYFLDQFQYLYDLFILNPDSPDTKKYRGTFVHALGTFLLKIEKILKIGRKADRARGKMEKKIKENWGKPKRDFRLEKDEQNLIIETIIGTQDMNIWCVLPSFVKFLLFF